MVEQQQLQLLVVIPQVPVRQLHHDLLLQVLFQEDISKWQVVRELLLVEVAQRTIKTKQLKLLLLNQVVQQEALLIQTTNL